jgi:alkylmercury lyase-like protein
VPKVEVGLESIDQAVRVQVYRLFVELGRAPVPAEVAHALDLRQEAVEDALRRLADDHALVLAPGTPYIWMANPLSAIPTPFSVESGGRAFFGNCIWDAMGVVAMLGGTGTVRTWCPDCQEPMEVAVSDGHLTSAECVVHYAVPAAHWWDDIGFN